MHAWKMYEIQSDNNDERFQWLGDSNNWVGHRGLSAWGIQTGPFAALKAHFVLEDFQLFHFHTGRPILITPEG